MTSQRNKATQGTPQNFYVAHARHGVPRGALVCRLKTLKKRRKMLKKRRRALTKKHCLIGLASGKWMRALWSVSLLLFYLGEIQEYLRQMHGCCLLTRYSWELVCHILCARKSQTNTSVYTLMCLCVSLSMCVTFGQATVGDGFNALLGGVLRACGRQTWGAGLNLFSNWCVCVSV